MGAEVGADSSFVHHACVHIGRVMPWPKVGGGGACAPLVPAPMPSHFLHLSLGHGGLC